MSPQKQTLFFLSSILLLDLALCSHDQPLSTICSRSTTSSATDAFSKNLHHLMLLLATKAPAIGFEIGSVGSGSARVNGLAMCRGDVTSSGCGACIRAAYAHLQRLCRRKREAIVWLDRCLLRYSHSEFFGDVDLSHRVFMSSAARNSLNPLAFDDKVAELMSSLMKKAYLSPLLFAAGDTEAGEVGSRLYGLVQCTKDLSGGDCKTCLAMAISQLPICCSGRRGGRVFGGSCTIRYELYPFFDA